MNRIVLMSMVAWALAAALVLGSAAQSDDCYSRCAYALGGQDAVSASIYDNCISRCRVGTGRQGPTYAAVAISETTYRAGVSHGASSRAQAEHDAVAKCVRNSGGPDCTSIRSAGGGCLGIAISQQDRRYGASGLSESRPAAWTAALSLCRTNGGRSCSVVATPCSWDDPQYASPLPLPPGDAGVTIDPRIVGTWVININPGRWVWEIGAHGTYEFRSEAPDAAPTHAGLITAANGQWTLQATAGSADIDGGTYHLVGSDSLVMTGKLGTGNWRRLR